MSGAWSETSCRSSPRRSAAGSSRAASRARPAASASSYAPGGRRTSAAGAGPQGQTHERSPAPAHRDHPWSMRPESRFNLRARSRRREGVSVFAGGAVQRWIPPPPRISASGLMRIGAIASLDRTPAGLRAYGIHANRVKRSSQTTGSPKTPWSPGPAGVADCQLVPARARCSASAPPTWPTPMLPARMSRCCASRLVESFGEDGPPCGRRLRRGRGAVALIPRGWFARGHPRPAARRSHGPRRRGPAARLSRPGRRAARCSR